MTRKGGAIARGLARRVLRTARDVAFAGGLAGVLVLAVVVTRGDAEAPKAEPDSDLPTLFIPHTPPARNFPCSKCHRHVTPNREKRTLELAHTSVTLKHAQSTRWCLDCHDGDRLRLPNGELIDYDKSYILCGQCHGTTFRDWKAGIHGKRTGGWNGERYYRLCVSCHDPHQPKFKPIEPKPAPMRPENIQ